ncbi:MAG: tyrosine-type recombinase/integrase [Gammaproteobacteria bacterium]
MATIEKRDTGEGITYRVKVRIKGHPAQSATFERLTDARRWAQSTEVAIRERRYFKTTEAQRRTLAELIDRYTRDVFPQKGAWARSQATQLAWWRAELGALSLADVTPAMVAEARDKLARGMTVRGGQRSPSTICRYLAALSHAFAIAVKEWGWLEDSPMRKVTKPREPRGRVRYLADEERGRLLEACRKSESPDLYCAVVIALSTGARRMEVLGLRWGQVDFSRRAITLLETKNGEIRSLPLVGHAFDLMAERAKVRRIDTDLVFPGRKKNRPVDLRAPFETAVKRAGVEDFRWHDLRHSAASYLAMNGATLAEIAEVLGHKTLAMVKRYAHLSQAHTTRVVEAMNARIFG